MLSLKRSFGQSVDEDDFDSEGRRRRNPGATNNNNHYQGEGEDNLTEEDCERLECSIATLGRQAYGLVQRFRESLGNQQQQQIEQNVV